VSVANFDVSFSRKVLKKTYIPRVKGLYDSTSGVYNDKIKYFYFYPEY